MRMFGLKPRIRVVSSTRIDTDRLVLRCPAAADASQISSLLGNWNVAHWVVRVPFPFRPEHAAAWIARSAEERAVGAGWPFLITLRDGHALMGSMDLSLEGDRSSGALGYWLGEDYWGQGYATEAAVAMIGFAFDILKLKEVTANALPDNLRSIRVLEKAGLRHVGRQVEDTVERGRVDTELFALKRSTWQGP
ncbi:MAG: N-acetyltransferase [Rhodospirillales bacterium]|nr:N-acetyltransferase [Rhodospirillales bacterium]